MEKIRTYCNQKRDLLFTIADSLVKANNFYQQLLKNIHNGNLVDNLDSVNNGSDMQFLSKLKEASVSEESFDNELKELLANFSTKDKETKVFALMMFSSYYTSIAEGRRSFDMHKDISKLLAVDLAASYLILSFGIEFGQMPKQFNEIKRNANHRNIIKPKMDIRWEKICKTLNKMKDDKKYQERSFSISGISGIIHHFLDVDKQTIIRDFYDHLGDKIPGKKYQISDLLNMCYKS